MNEYENADKKQQDIIDEINEKNKEEIDLEPVYSEEGAEDNIAPLDLFEYEIINDGSVATTYMDRLPSKTARIIGIRENYINGYEAEQDKIIDSNYRIEHERVKDILIIPYQVRLNKDGQLVENGDTTQDSELYKITEVNLSIYGSSETGGGYKNFPTIRKIIYPNTVERILYSGSEGSVAEIVLSNNINRIESSIFSEMGFLRKVVMSDNVTSIGESAFYDSGLQEINMSKNIYTIERGAFERCDIKEITIPQNVTTLEEDVFYGCTDLSKVNIEGKLNRIEGWAFYNCFNIKEIIIPGDIEYIGQRAFQNWGEDQTIYFECSESNERNWNYNWDYNCDAKIVWNYNPDGTTE